MPDLTEIINRTKRSQDTAARVLNNTNNENGGTDSRENAPREVEKPENAVARNILPVANAGRNQIAIEGSELVLDGSGSKDKDGEILSYQWLQLRGPKVDLDGVNKANAKFLTPNIEQSEILTFRLTVTDEKGGSDSAVTAVKINRDDSRLPTSKLLDEPPSRPSASSGPTGSSIGSLQLGNSTNSTAK